MAYYKTEKSQHAQLWQDPLTPVAVAQEKASMSLAIYIEMVEKANDMIFDR